jgi:hypothetical protein
MLVWPNKAPTEVLDYDLDWAPRLAGDTISTSNWSITQSDTPASGSLAIQSSSYLPTRTKVWLTGGNLGQSYALLNTITTAGSETMVETVVIVVRAK